MILDIVVSPFVQNHIHQIPILTPSIQITRSFHKYESKKIYQMMIWPENLFPFEAARVRAELPLSLTWITLAPPLMSRWATSLCSFKQAQINGL